MNKKQIAYILIGCGVAVLLYVLLVKKKGTDSAGTASATRYGSSSLFGGNEPWTPQSGRQPTQAEQQAWMDSFLQNYFANKK